jgi:Polysaccharide deacetylase
MATITTNTTITVPAGALLLFKAGGIARAIDDAGNVYQIGLNDMTMGPYAKAQTVEVLVTSGSIEYMVDAQGDGSDVVKFDRYSNTITDPASLDAVRGAVQSFGTRAGIVVAPATSSTAAAGWGVSGSGVTLTDVPGAYGTRNATRIDFPAGDQYLTLRRKIAVDANGCFGKVELPVYIPRLFGNGAVEYFVSSDTPAADPPTVTATNRTRVAFPNALFKRNSWQILSCDPTVSGTDVPNQVTVAVSGSGCGTAFKQIEVYIFCPAAATERYMMISDIAVGGYAKPFLMLSFDGAGTTASHVTLLEPILRRHGLKAIFAPQGQIIGTYAKTLQRLKAAGHEIANEGMNHTNYGSSPATLYSDYATASANLAANGLAETPTPSFMAPQLSILTNDIAGLHGAGVKLIRSGNRDLFPVSALGAEELTIGSYAGDQKTSAEMIDYLDRMEAHGESGLLLCHEPVAGVAGALQVNMTEFAAFAAEVATRMAQGRLLQGTASEFVSLYQRR